MDKITKEVHEHEEISEALAFFDRSLLASSADIEGFRKFFDEYIVAHFKFEEEEIFPAIMKSGTQEEISLVQALLDEHSQIMNMVNQFKKLLSRYGLQPSEIQRNEFIELYKKIIKTTLYHAHREDATLFPILRKYEINLK